MLNEVKSRLLSGKKLSIIIFVIILLILGCDKQGILKFKALGSIEIKFVTNETKTDWPEEFTAHIVIERDDIDTIEKDLTIKYNPSDSIYKAVEVVEIPVEKQLDLTVTALINGENWEGHSDIYLDPDQTRIVEIEMGKIIPEGLVAYYPFNGNANDESGNGNDGTPHNGVDFTVVDRFDSIGCASGFDGVDDYITINEDESLDIDSTLTLVAWIYMVTNDQNPVIVLKKHSYQFCVYYGKVLFGVGVGPGQWTNLNSNSTIPLNIWVHVVGSFDESTGELKIYIDGYLDVSLTNPGTQISPYVEGLYIGSDRGLSQFWNGSIDDIRIYNRVLSEAEIDSLYHEGGWPIIDIEWCTVPAGEYTYGEGDTIKTIDYDYQIMKYEVTNVQYVTYLAQALAAGDIWFNADYVVGYYEGDEHWPAGNYDFYDLGTPSGSYNYARISYDGDSFIINVPSGYNPGDFDNHPVVYGTWFGAWAFAEYYGYRLPSNYEWEKAARSNTSWDYPWGDDIDGSRANYINSGDPFDNGTTPVGYYNGDIHNGFQTTNSTSPFGVYDMAGNVCDWIDSFDSDPPSIRIRRGGSWLNDPDYARSWVRGNNWPNNPLNNLGFRCVRN